MAERRVLELFAGCGGASLGLHRAGWRHLACVERAPAAAATLQAAGFPALLADVRDVDWAAWAHASDWTFNGGPDRASDALFLIAGIRRIEVEEGLALQGFPVGWPLQGTREEQYAQVGNAVPPALAEAVGSTVAFAHVVHERLGRSPEVADALRRSGIAIPTRRAA